MSEQYEFRMSVSIYVYLLTCSFVNGGGAAGTSTFDAITAIYFRLKSKQQNKRGISRLAQPSLLCTSSEHARPTNDRDPAFARRSRQNTTLLHT